ncbi:MAG TPA: allantoicase [Mycobacterium sp.]|nr:allantoicase [Mycobacterium sp.]
MPMCDLAARLLGGTVMAASDEAFGEKENLLNPEPVQFVPGSFGARGEIVDGWETRRRREPGVDWVSVRLGAPGIIRSIDVDTTSFTGNHPVGCKIEACGVEGYPGPEDLTHADWHEIVPDSPLTADTSNLLSVDSDTRFTHVRLTIWPDGGVGRLRIYGQPVPDPRDFDIGAQDLASQQCGGQVIDSSDGFYSPARALNRPDMARSMGEGWETRRSRGREPDWVIIKLAARAHVHGLVVDTAYFRYNASAAVSLDGADHHLTDGTAASDPTSWSWKELLPQTTLQPDTRHTYWLTDLNPASYLPPVTHVRLQALPDGGLSRVRVIATPDSEGRWVLAQTWWNSLPASHLTQIVTGAGISVTVANELIARRPLLDNNDLRQADDFAGIEPATSTIIGRLLLGVAG